MPNRVVFLDIDGVLNSHVYLSSDARPRDVPYEGNEHYMLDPAAVLRLNRVIEATGAQVVISSSWRHGWTIERLREILKDRGFVGEIIDITPDVLEGCRGDEIAQWLDEHPGIEKFIAIDDDRDESFIMTHHLIHTSFYRGFQDEHADEAIHLLL